MKIPRQACKLCQMRLERKLRVNVITRANSDYSIILNFSSAKPVCQLNSIMLPEKVKYFWYNQFKVECFRSHLFSRGMAEILFSGVEIQVVLAKLRTYQLL